MYSGDINSYMYEINSLETEIQSHRKRLKELTQRKKMLIGNVIQNLQENDEKQIVIRGNKYIIQEKTKSQVKPKKKKKQDVMNVLSQVVEERHDAEELYKQVEKAWKGETKTDFTLKKA